MSEIDPNQAKLTSTPVELHSHGNTIPPSNRDDSHIAGFNHWVQLMFNNCIPVRVSQKDLREIKNGHYFST